MEMSFGQIYIEPGISFPFNSKFQTLISGNITYYFSPSGNSLPPGDGSRTGLMFNISCKAGIKENEIIGPSFFPENRKVEYTIFLPYKLIVEDEDWVSAFVGFLMSAVREILKTLGIGSIDDDCDCEIRRELKANLELYSKRR